MMSVLENDLEVETDQLSYAELTRQLALERAKSEALQLQLRRMQKRGRKVHSHGHVHDSTHTGHSLSMDSNASTPSIPDIYQYLKEAVSSDTALEVINKQCELIGLDKSTEQKIAALQKAHSHVQTAMAMLAGEPVIVDYSDHSDVETNQSQTDDDENDDGVGRASLMKITYRNNRLDTDENGNSIFVDTTHSSVDPLGRGFVAGAPAAKQSTFSTAGYDHNEEELMDVQCVEADWSKLRLSKELESQLKLSKRTNRGDLGQVLDFEAHPAVLGLDHKAFPFVQVQKSPNAHTSSSSFQGRSRDSVTSASSGSSSGGNARGSISNRSSQKVQNSPMNILANGLNAKGIGNEGFGRALKEVLDQREKRRKLERQRELFRLPARESWRYASDQLPCANIREFCFPNGVLVQYVSKNAAEYLVGEKFDRYHLVQLTGANGQATYACVLTVTKIVSAAFAPAQAAAPAPDGAKSEEKREALDEMFVVNALEAMMSLKKPARIIRSFMRRLIKFIKKQRWDNVMHGNFTGHMGGGASHNSDSNGDESGNNNETGHAQPVSRATRMMQIIAEATGGRHSSMLQKSAVPSNPEPTVSPSRDERPAAGRTFMSSLFGSSAASPAPAPAPAQATSGGFLSRWSNNKAPEPSPAKPASPPVKPVKPAAVAGISSGLVSSTNIDVDTTVSSSATTANDTEDLLGITTSFNGERLTDNLSDLSITVGTPPNASPSNNSHINNIPRKMSMAINRKNSDGTAVSVSSSVSNALSRDKDFTEALKSMPAGIAGLPMSLPTAEDDSSEESSLDGSNSGDMTVEVVGGDVLHSSETMVTWDNLSGSDGTPRGEEKDESNQSKQRTVALDYKCIVSKIAYCLVSTKPIQALGFKILKAMADAERQVLVEGGESGENDVDPYGRERKRTFSGNSVGSSSIHSSGGEGKPVKSKNSVTATPVSNNGVGLLLDMGNSSPASGKQIYHAEITHNLSCMQLSDVSMFRNSFLHRVHQQICRWSALGGLKLFLASNFSSALMVSKTLKGNVAKQLPKPSRRSLKGAIAAVSTGSVKWEADGKSNVTVSPGATGLNLKHPRSRTGSFVGGGIAQSRRIPQEVHAIISGYVNATPTMPEGFVVNLTTLPSVDELSAAVMFSYLNSSMIFKLINLLLMEKSLVICGKNSGIVSNIALAVKNLILPFRWEGVFVPLVPDSARELFGAPVPFILGTTTSPRDCDVSPSSAILYLQDDENIDTTLKSRSDLNAPDVKSPVTGTSKDSKHGGSGSGATTTSAHSTGTSGSTPTTTSMHTPVETKKDAKPVLSRSRSKTTASRLKYTGRQANSEVKLLSNVTSSAHQAGFTASLPETVAWFIRLPDSLNADMPHDEQLECMIDDTKRYLRRSRATYCAMQLENDYVQHIHEGGTNSTFFFSRQPTLDVQYLLSMTRKEQRAVATLVRTLYEHNVRFCGDAIDPTAWRRYVRYNDMTGEEEFYPNWFMEPVRRHVEFQEAVVQTQLFVGFMDHVREESLKKDHDRQFIRDWVGFRMRKISLLNSLRA